MNTLRIPRALHPLAWWAWALGLATAASLTTNPLLLALILVVAGCVVAARRSNAPWARAFRAYLVIGLIVVATRVVFRIIFGGSTAGGEYVLIRLPSVSIGDVVLGGPVTVESVVAALYDGLRLATLLCCIGAANTLANPKRALRSLPGALYEIGIAITVAITIAPQLVESAQRVHRARRLRGATSRGRRAVRNVAMPVFHSALDRSFQLAAAMDARGYGRSTAVAPEVRRATNTCMLVGLVGLCVGAYGMLDTTAPRMLGAPMLVAGAAAAVVGLSLGGRRVTRTRYRPDPWRTPEWLTLGCGAVVAAAMITTAHLNPAPLHPSVYPLEWPTLPVLPVVGLGVALLPAFLTPPPGDRL
jgi:energy-coupling factor transport system permease protein